MNSSCWCTFDRRAYRFGFILALAGLLSGLIGASAQTYDCPPRPSPQPGPDYSGKTLNGANFSQQDLTNTNFSNAHLIGANFVGATHRQPYLLYLCHAHLCRFLANQSQRRRQRHLRGKPGDYHRPRQRSPQAQLPDGVSSRDDEL
jgi:hypothetical protein